VELGAKDVVDAAAADGCDDTIAQGAAASELDADAKDVVDAAAAEGGEVAEVAEDAVVDAAAKAKALGGNLGGVATGRVFG
jgi:hypothetical protein